MDVGFESAGVQVVFANELVKEAAETYKANHPNGMMINDDINNIIFRLIIPYFQSKINPF